MATWHSRVQRTLSILSLHLWSIIKDSNSAAMVQGLVHFVAFSENSPRCLPMEPLSAMIERVFSACCSTPRQPWAAGAPYEFYRRSPPACQRIRVPAKIARIPSRRHCNHNRLEHSQPHRIPSQSLNFPKQLTEYAVAQREFCQQGIQRSYLTYWQTSC